MPENNNRIFVGNGREFGQYGQIGLNICLDDIPEEHVIAAKNGKRYIKLNVSRKRQPDQYNNTHNVEVNTWKPENKQG